MTAPRAEFRVTADFAEFERATEWFRARLPVTTGQLAQLDDDARARAWWIAGTAQADVVQHVHESLTEAIAKGTPLEEWKASIKDTLTKAWGRSNSPRLDTIFRNATQQALIAGRYQQIHDPQVKRFRPYGLFDGIEDSRQTVVCKSADGTVLPLDHPWWATHTPQLHHRCRSSIRSLTARQARERGITEDPPTDDADEGFGAPPVLSSLPPDKPRPPAIAAELEQKLGAPKPPPLVKRSKRNPDHDPKRWRQHFEEQGFPADVSRRMAWGKAMSERGLDLSSSELRKAAKRLRDAGISVQWELFRDLDSPLRELGPTTHQRALAGLVAHAKAISPNRRLTVKALLDAAEATGDDAARARADAGLAFYRLLSDKSLKHPTEGYAFEYVSRETRAYFSPSKKKLLWSLNPGILEHEWAHALDHFNPGMGLAAVRFRDARVEGDELHELADLVQLPYPKGELCKLYRGLHPYVGRVYGASKTVSEVSSMGVEYLTDDRIAQLLEDDPDLYWFVIGQLAGDKNAI